MANDRITVKIAGDARSLVTALNAARTSTLGFAAALSVACSRFGPMAAVGLATAGGVLAVGKAMTTSLRAARDYESAFAGVLKTVDEGPEVLSRLEEGFQLLSLQIPVTAEELARIGEIGGQLDIPADELLSFTEHVARLSTAVADITTETAALSLAKLSAVMGTSTSQIGAMASMLVHLGNNSRTTEGSILSMAMNVAGIKRSMQLTEPEVFALATTLSEVGISAEKGGTAITRAINDMDKAVELGGRKLDNFAAVAGMSTADFKATFEKNTMEAVGAFLDGMGRLQDAGQGTSRILEDIGLQNVRVSDVLRRSGGAYEFLKKNLENAKQAFIDQNRHIEESEKRFKTFDSKMQITGNMMQMVWRNLGEGVMMFALQFLPAIQAAIEELFHFVEPMKQVLSHGAVAQVVVAAMSSAWDALRGVLWALSPAVMMFVSNIKETAPLGVIVGEGLVQLARSAIYVATGYQLARKAILDFADDLVGASYAQAEIANLTRLDQALDKVMIDTSRAGESWAARIEKLKKELSAMGGDRPVAPPRPPPEIRTTSEDEARAREKLEDEKRKAREQAAKEHVDRINEIMRGFTGADALVEAWDFDEAFEKLGGATGIVTSRLDEAMLATSKLAQETAGTDVSIEKASQSWSLWGELLKRTGGDLSKLGTQDLQNVNTSLETLVDVMKAAGIPASQIAEVQRHLSTTTGELKERQEEATKSTFDWGKALSSLKDIMDIFGLSTENALVNAISGFTAGAAAAQKLSDQLGERGFEWSNIKDNFSEIIGIAGQFATAFKGATDSSSGLSRALGGAAVGAQFAKSLGLGIKGQIAGAIIGGVAGLFRKPGWVKAGEAAGKVFGEKVSDALAKEIEKRAKDLGVSLESASLLSINDVMAESAKDAREFATQGVQLMQAIASGAVPAAEGIKEVGTAFTSMVEAAQSAGSVGDAAIRGMIAGAKATGQEIPEIAEHIKSELSKAQAGIAKMIATFSTEEDTEGEFLSGLLFGSGDSGSYIEANAKDQATIFTAVFWASVAEQGIVAASDAMRESFQSLWDNLSETAGGGEFAEQLLGPVMSAMNLTAEGGLFRGAAEAAAGLQDALQGLANTGYLTGDAFGAIQSQAQVSFQQMIEGGADANTALLSIAPLLQDIQSAAQNYGMEIDANTQSLIDQARQAGVAFKIDPMQRMVEVLEAIAVKLGAEIPERLGTMANAAETAFGNTAQSGSAMVSDLSNAVVDVAQTTTDNISGLAEGMSSMMIESADISQAAIQDMAAHLNDLKVTIPVNFDPKDLNFPGGGTGAPGGHGGQEQKAAGGFDAIIRRDKVFKAHAGERVTIMPAKDTAGTGGAGGTFTQEVASQVVGALGGMLGSSDGTPINLTVNIGGVKLYEDMFIASRNRNLRIHENAIVRE